MSQQRMLKAFVGFGLSEMDTQVYVFLAKEGPQKARDISKALGIYKQKLYPSLKNLQSKGVVSATLEHPARFSAVQFERVLDLFIKAKMEEAQIIQQEKAELLSSWQPIPVQEDGSNSARFVVVEGRNIIYSRIKQMINETKSRLLIISAVSGLARADQFGLLDVALKHPLRSKIQFRFLTHLSEENVDAMKALLKRTPKTMLFFEVRNPDLGLSLFPHMIIRDEEEVVFFINSKVDGSISEPDNVCLWTNCKDLVNAFSGVFEDLWSNSIAIERKITEIENGKPRSKAFIISDAETAKKKYNKILQSAKEEIFITTSSKGLIRSWENVPQLRSLTERGVSVKIMAPIDCENFEAGEQLSKFCEVKHAPMNYLGTTIVDGKHRFQFKMRSPDQEKLESTPNFENTFYTNDLEYAEKTRNTLADVWKNARTPSSITLESILVHYGPTLTPLPKNILPTRERTSNATILDVKPLGAIAEKDILNKVLNAQKIRAKNPQNGIGRMYATVATAIIHPPDYFNLPDIMIFVQKVEKQSTFGAEDALIIFLWLKTPTGYAYVPVAQVGDNPSALSFRKRLFAGTHAGQNFQLVKKDELQIRVHGNTMFAGWTVPIPLYPPLYKLPPACILVEGYGDVKSTAVSLQYVSGFKSQIEENYFDAFVTFFHPSSKYSGPRTDGRFVRDFIATSTPPTDKR